MDKFIIHGNNKIKGVISASGSKNAGLPIMAATLLAPGKYTIKNVPNLTDIHTMGKLLHIIGAEVSFSDNSLKITTDGCNNLSAPYDLVKTMRASIYVLGPPTCSKRSSKGFFARRMRNWSSSHRSPLERIYKIRCKYQSRTWLYLCAC